MLPLALQVQARLLDLRGQASGLRMPWSRPGAGGGSQYRGRQLTNGRGGRRRSWRHGGRPWGRTRGRQTSGLHFPPAAAAGSARADAALGGRHPAFVWGSSGRVVPPGLLVAGVEAVPARGARHAGDPRRRPLTHQRPWRSYGQNLVTGAGGDLGRSVRHGARCTSGGHVVEGAGQQHARPAGSTVGRAPMGVPSSPPIAAQGVPEGEQCGPPVRRRSRPAALTRGPCTLGASGGPRSPATRAPPCFDLAARGHKGPAFETPRRRVGGLAPVFLRGRFRKAFTVHHKF